MRHAPFAPGSKGSVELCGDVGDGQGFRQLVAPEHAPTMKLSGGTGIPVHARIGNYRGAGIGIDETSYFDGFTVATTRATAETNALGGLQSAPAGQCADNALGQYQYGPGLTG